MPNISTKFDFVFKPLAGFIPVPFLRALSYNESSLNPNSVTKSSNATGLFQVVKTVLSDYNLQHGTKYTLEQVKDPALNSKIGIGLISRIVQGYQKNHPVSLAMDWTSPRYVELVVQGFNAGYSEAGGVGFVVGKLEKLGVPVEKITVDTVAQAAKELRASKYLYEPARIKYAKAVARTYFEELKKDLLNVASPSWPPSPAKDLLAEGSSKESNPVVSALQDKDNEVSSLASLSGRNVKDVSNKDVSSKDVSSKKVPKDAVRFVVRPKGSEHIQIPATMGNTIILLALPLAAILAASLFKKHRAAPMRSF